MSSSIALTRLALPAWSGGALLLVFAAGLAGCSDRPQFAPACPNTGILEDGADVTTFRSQGTDLTDMVYDGRITGLSGKCSASDSGHLQTVLSVNMEVTRGPAMQGRTATITYFVSVSKGNAILDKRDYMLPVSFDRNSSKVRLTGDEITLVLPTPGKVTGADYRVLVGFQLTEAGTTGLQPPPRPPLE